MGRPRLQLHNVLKAITPNVYFQPPSNVQMQYPCITYKRDFAETEFADNIPYGYTKRYMITVIDQNPDGTIPDEIAKLPMCTFNRFYTADNLNHDVFQIFF
jgi:hypothetical protein